MNMQLNAYEIAECPRCGWKIPYSEEHVAYEQGVRIAKLEQLVRRMHASWARFNGFRNTDIHGETERRFIDAFEKDMKELGIDTEGGA